MNPCFETATRLARAIRAGRLESVEATRVAFIRQSQQEPLRIDGVDHPYFFAGTSYNFLANLTGQPSVVLPCGFSRDGLPIGLQLTGRKWRDIELLGVARVVEKLLPPCPLPPAYA